MGFLDKLLGRSDQIKEKAAEHSDTIGQGVDKAGEAANKATGGRFEEQVGKVTDKAKDGVDQLGDQGGPDQGGSDQEGGSPEGSGPEGGPDEGRGSGT